MKQLKQVVLCATVLLAPHWAWASIGKVAALSGSATRTAKDGTKVDLANGSDVLLEDTVTVAPGGGLKLELNDKSVIMLDGGSSLFVEKAEFEGQERKGFSAKLIVGKFWAKVTKLLSGSDAKFQVTTERAVAGVRGTVFRVDAVALVKGTKPKSTVVRVLEGVVRVSKAGSAGPRREVPGPMEVTKEKWEANFRELQANQQVTVGEELGKVMPLDTKAKDAFGEFIEKNQ